MIGDFPCKAVRYILLDRETWVKIWLPYKTMPQDVKTQHPIPQSIVTGSVLFFGEKKFS
jgi:hypothetical protein